MIKDDTKSQISLFDLPVQEDAPASATVTTTVTKQTATAAERKRSTKQQPDASVMAVKPATRRERRSETVRPAPRGEQPKVVPGAVPEGDVRLTANIRLDLHLKLKIAAATRRTTIGELIETLVEQYL